MKLVIQIPCFNEEAVLPLTLPCMPRTLAGVDEIEIVVIDDGSRDNTVEVAQNHGVKHIVKLPANQGLASAFIAGLERSMALGADVIVNLDADNQYDASCMQDLVQPILDGKADIVVGVRDIENILHFSLVKKICQRLGSWAVRKISKTSVEDVTSGYRAYSKRAAMYLNVFSNFTYTLETLIQAGYSKLIVTTVPVRINPKTRESRLFRGNFEYIRKSIATIFTVYIIYQPFNAFRIAAISTAIPGLFFIFRFLYYYFTISGPTGHTQSLVFATIFLILSFNLLMIGILADLFGVNRRLLEKILFILRDQDANKR